MTTMRIRGLEGAVKAIEGREKRVLGAVTKALVVQGHFAETRAKQAAPAKTGTMRALIFRTSPEVTPEEVLVTVRGGVGYTPYQEYGTGERGAKSNYLPASFYRLDWPGITAKKFFLSASKEVLPKLAAALKKALETK